MTGSVPTGAKVLQPKLRIALTALCVLLFIVLLIGAGSIPFVYESQSIRYKLGIDKTLLRTGKVMGILAATLLLMQIVLAARFKILDRVFALNRLYIMHRVNAVVIAVLAVLHALFVFAPEDITSIPVELKYWPEVLGAIMLLIIWLLTATGIWRLFLGFAFHRWWVFHRAAALTAAAIVVVHVLYGSDTFESGTARTIIFLAAGVYALIFGWVKIKPALIKMKPYTVRGVTIAGGDAYSVEMSPQKGAVINYIPGQFAFVTFRSNEIPAEEHPFTISSSPSRPGTLLFTIRCSGDWTALISRLMPGETAFIDGPYGRFSYFFCKDNEEIVMIAGGIGITPMLSMLRYMADTGDARKVTLIWSNRTKEDIVFADEFIELEKRLTGLKIIYLFTRQPDSTGAGGRLTAEKTANLLSRCSRSAPAFLCGPPLMMETVREGLVKNGFSLHRIYSEEFGL